MKKMIINNQLKGLIILNQKLNLRFELRIQTCKLHFIKFIAPYSQNDSKLIVDSDKNCFFINEFFNKEEFYWLFKIEQINNDNLHIKSQPLDKNEDYKFYISIAK